MATRVRKPASTKSLSLEPVPETVVATTPRRRSPTSSTGSTTTTSTRASSVRRATSSSGSHRALNLSELDAGVISRVEPPIVESPPSAPVAAMVASTPAPIVVEPSPPPEVALAETIDRLRQELNSVREIVQGNAQRGAEDLSRNAHQTVLMVTGVAHHLDKVAAQLVDMAGVVRAQAQTVARVEATVVALHDSMKAQMVLFEKARTPSPPISDERLQKAVEKALAPLIAELGSLRTQSLQQDGLERLENYRLATELKQIRVAVELGGPLSPVSSVLPRVVSALRAGRR